MIIQATSNRNNTTYITQELVKIALNSLLYSTQRCLHSPLEDIGLVDQLIMKWGLPPCDSNRTYALHCLLTSLIQEELLRHRHAFDFPANGNENSISEVRATIAQDAHMSSPELLSWSWLYYRFVRVEFNISPKDFIKIAFIDERTLRRYQNHGVWRLTHCLIAREQIVQEELSSTLSISYQS